MENSPSQLTTFLHLLDEYQARQKARPVDFLKLTPKQLETVSRWAPINLFLGGNQSGKTTFGVWTCLQIARGKHPTLSERYPAPNEQWAVSLDFNVSQTVVEKKLRDLVPPAEVLKWPSFHDRNLYLTNGSIIRFKSCDSGWQKFQGATITGVWFDEEPPQDIYNESLIRVQAKQGYVLFTMTPVPDEASEGMSWTFDEIYGKQDLTRISVVEVSIYDNPHLPEQAVKNIESNYTGAEREARIFGKFSGLSNLIFHELRPYHVVPRYEIPTHWTRYSCLDYGIAAPTAVLWLAVDEMHRHHFYREYYEKGRTVRENAEAILAIEKAASENVRFRFIDPHANARDMQTGKTTQEAYLLAEYPTILGSNDWEGSVLRAKQALADIVTDPEGKKLHKVQIQEHLKNFIFELKHYVRVHSGPRQDFKDKPRKRNDHLVDDFRYLEAEMLRYIDPKKELPQSHWRPRRYL